MKNEMLTDQLKVPIDTNLLIPEHDIYIEETLVPFRICLRLKFEIYIDLRISYKLRIY